MNIIITAGPTVEPIDDVRCITNFSSGKMGVALAESAIARGHSVTMICGPMTAVPPKAATVVCVRTANEMRDELARNFPACDALIMAAAVCDFRPEHKATGKIKRNGPGLTLNLIPTLDILAEVAEKKGWRVVVGFALEHENGIDSARKKCAEKNCNFVCLNSPKALDSDHTEITLVYRGGNVLPLPNLPKAEAAGLIIGAVERIREERA
ncbi:MAG: phosphopantothenoylcysteine decarboxylase [Candidatus Brocadiia bacterium]